MCNAAMRMFDIERRLAIRLNGKDVAHAMVEFSV
jgi:hypothetical protein